MSSPTKLFTLALKAQKNAHAPYSGYQIGAALKLSNGQYFSGCNIENASYGGTVCAERVAIWTGLSQFPGTWIKEILVISKAKNPWPPCGMCRQVMAEFCRPDTLVHVANSQGIKKTWIFCELFPDAFSPEHLKKQTTLKRK